MTSVAGSNSDELDLDQVEITQFGPAAEDTAIGENWRP